MLIGQAFADLELGRQAQIGARLFDLRLKDRRVELRNELVLLHHRIEIRRERLDCPRHL